MPCCSAGFASYASIELEFPQALRGLLVPFGVFQETRLCEPVVAFGAKARKLAACRAW